MARLAPHTPDSRSDSSVDHRVVEFDRFVNDQIRKTSRTVRLLDAGQALLRLVATAAAVLLVVALLEHWVVPGGLGAAGRYGVFAAMMAAAAWWLWRDVAPLFRRRINPVYAAQTIEQASPTLKNSLVNLLLFRSHREQIPSAVYQTIEQQAAQRLASVADQEAVDGRGLVRWGYVLVATLAIGVLYALVSPKNPFASAARVLMPWAEIAAPTRVQITDVTPGAAEVAVGDEVAVGATITGLEAGEPAELVVLSPTGRAAAGRTPLTESDGLNRFATGWRPIAAGNPITDGSRAATLRYRIEAGDARSPVYRLSLLTAPSIVVRSVAYDYPDYTGYLDRTAEGIGDVRAIEGTVVTINSEANVPIASAQVDLQGDGRPDKAMAVDGATAEAAFTLALREDRRTPRHSSYVLRLTSTDDRTNADPASYRIEVLPDYEPEAAILAPGEPVREVRLGETLPIRVEARDPDFGLASVRLVGESLGDAVFDAELLIRPAGGRHEGRFEATWRFTPAEHGLRAGDVVEYWVAAEDIRQPEPHRGVSPRQRLKIVAGGINPADPDGDANQNPGEPGQGGDAGQRGGSQGQDGEQDGEQADNQGEPGEGQSGGGQQGESGPEQGGEQGGEKGDGENGEGNQPGSQAGGDEQPSRNGEQPGENQEQGGESGNDSNNNQGGVASNDPAQSGGGESQAEGRGQQGKADANAGGDQQGSGGERTGERGSGDQPPSGERGSGQPSSDGAEQKPSGSDTPASDQGPDSDQAPVSNQGDDDATAFDRIRDHLANKQGEPQQGGGEQQQPGGGGSTDQQPPSRSTDTPPPAGEGQPDGGERGSSEGADGGSQGADESNGRNANGQGQENQGQENRGQESQGQGGRGQEGAGGDRDSSTQQPPREPGANPGDADGSPANDRKQSDDSTSSESGGDVGNQDSAENSRAPREGTGGTGKNQAADQGDGAAGDQGAGEQGEGAGKQQTSNGKRGQPGDGRSGAGQNRRDGRGNQSGGEPSSDGNQGDGKQGQGDRGDGSDRNQQSEGAQGDGQSSEQNGAEGSPSQSGDRGQSDSSSRNGNDSSNSQRGGEQTEGEGQPGGQQGSDPSGSNRSDQQDASESDSPSQSPRGDQQGGQRGGTPNGAPGTGGDGPGRPGDDQGADEANLEYARKQTELVLDKLSDQLERNQVDRELLDRLGWSEQDLRKFVDRWESRKQAAQQRGPAGKQELDQALRSLGLKPRRLEGGSAAAEDTLRDVQSGRRSTVPAKFRERLRQYNQGLSRDRNYSGS